MSDPEIVRLKKKIQTLTEFNVQLQEQVQELSMKIGDYQARNIEYLNNNLLLKVHKEKASNEEAMRLQFNKAISDEREKTLKYKKENEVLQERIHYLDKQVKDNEIYIQKLQIKNEKLQKDLIVFSEKHEAQDYIDQIKRKEQEISKFDEQREKQTREFNELCDRMEEVIAENRVLRQMADLPENFGIDMSKIRIGDRIKIEDYKAKIRILQHDIDDLETERAQLKHRIQFLANSLEVKEPPFHLLTPEQKVEVAKYAQNLYEGKENTQPERYDLLSRLREKDNQIRVLDEELSKLKSEGRGINTNTGMLRVPNVNNQLELMKKMLNDYKNDIINTINTKNGESNFIPDPRIHPPVPNFFTSNYNFNNNNDIYSVNQLPPVPLYNNSNINNTNEASSYRFNIRFRIQPNIIHEIFGVAENGNDPEALRKESCALQSQIIELLEIESRRNINDESLRKNLENVFNKLEKIALIQNEIFKRYMEKKINTEEEIKQLNININNLNDDLSRAQKKIDAYEETINELGKRDSNTLNKKLIEKMKENAILDGNYIKLNRKYKSLVEEEKTLREFLDLKEKNNLEKEKQLKETIIKLKKWKATLTKYLKFVNEKLQKSVDKTEYDKVCLDNRYLREKNNMLTLREISFTKESTMNQTLILKYKDLEDSYYLMEEGKYDAEIEVNYLKQRLQELDANYYNEQKAFRKLINILSALNKTYLQIRDAFLSINESKPSLYNDYQNSKKEGKNIFNDLSFLKGLTLDNSFITKTEFENCLKNLGVTEDDLTNADMILIYRALNCDESNKVDIRNFLKKLEQNSISEMDSEIEDKKILEDFIRVVQEKRQNLLLIFEHFDTNNNGCITREEFKYALGQLGISLDDKNITKLIFLVSGDSISDKDVNIQNLDNTDTFNYIEFCNLFEQKSKNYLLREKRQFLNKNKIQIDWKLNALTKIILAIDKNHLLIDDALKNRDKTEKGYLTFDEFDLFLNSIEAPLDSDKKKLFDYFDEEKLGYININNLKKALEQAKVQSDEYQKLYNSYSISNKAFDSEKDIKDKYIKLTEDKKYFEIRINNLQQKCNSLEERNNTLSKEITNYKNQNMANVDKYLEAQRELQDLREEFEAAGVKKSDYLKSQHENEALKREVVLLRIGMNTFKELYNASNLQIKHINLNEKKNLDEIEMYKKAMKDLQGESNQNSLIGKLYYTILISRWREAHTLRNYGELINDFGSLKEENFILEKDNKLLTQNLQQVNETLHKEIIENIKMMDKIENLENGILDGAIMNKNNKLNPLEEMKKLVSMLKEDKKESTQKLIMLKKKVVSLENDKNKLESRIDFCENLKNNIKFNNRDEFSKKLINLSEELSNVKLHNNILQRENTFEKENSAHLQRLNDQLNTSLKNYEIETTDWENKYTKMEELFRKKDEERQNKILAALERMKLYDNREVNHILNSKPLYGDNNISNIKSLPGINQSFAQLESDKDEKIKLLNEQIQSRDQEIQRLKKINEENAKYLKEGEGYLRSQNMEHNIGENNDKNDETKLVAQIAHRTIRQIEEQLKERNRQLNQKNKQIEDLYEEISKLKTANIQRVNFLEDQIKDAHDNTMLKLNKFIDNTNHNLIVKLTREELQLMSLNELEKLINDKDNAIAALAMELKSVKHENDTNYVVLKEKNKKISDLEMQYKLLKENTNEEFNKNIIEKLKKDIEIKNNLLDEERNKNNKIKNHYEQLYKQKLIKDEEEKLANTVYVPERLIINKEKSELYVKMDKLMLKNKKLSVENKKLLKEKKDLIDSKRNIELDLQKEKEKHNQGLQAQYKGSSLLKKEKEKLKKKNKELTEEIARLNQQISSLEHQLSNPPPPQQNKPVVSPPPNPVVPNQISSQNESLIKSQQESSQPKQEGSAYVAADIHKKIEEEEKAKKEKEKIKPKKVIYKGGEKLLVEFANFCNAKKINIRLHLRKYDTSDTKKISDDKFMNAVIELKTSFTENDIKELIKYCKPKEGGDIVIEDFIELLKSKGYNYKLKDETVISTDNKQVSKKYDYFENNPYNVNYQ